MNIIFLILSFNILYNFYWFKKNNPYSYIYFNELNSFFLKKKFDLDYWGLSNYQSYKYILKNDKRKIISIGTLSYNDLNDNLNALNEKEKYRIVLKHKDDYPDYLIDNYRISYKVFKTINKSQYLKDYNKVEEVIIDNNIVNTIYKKK